MEARIAPADQFTTPDDVATYPEGSVVGTGVAGPAGAFEVEIEAPDPGTYGVWVECSRTVGEGDLVGHTLAVAHLLVHEPLVLAAAPAPVEPGGTVTISGPWCVSQDRDGEPPVAYVEFLSESHLLEADDPQPFGEAWQLELTAPDEVGTYPVTATCSYDDTPEDGESPTDPVEPDLVMGPAAIVAAAYEPVDVVVAVQETTTTTTSEAPTATSTTSSPAAPPATGARPVTAQPAYTG